MLAYTQQASKQKSLLLHFLKPEKNYGIVEILPWPRISWLISELLLFNTQYFLCFKVYLIWVVTCQKRIKGATLEEALEVMRPASVLYLIYGPPHTYNHHIWTTIYIYQYRPFCLRTRCSSYHAFYEVSWRIRPGETCLTAGSVAGSLWMNEPLTIMIAFTEPLIWKLFIPAILTPWIYCWENIEVIIW